ncbi:MAG: fructose-bisphosphate aldolase, partial [Chloroflexi bacterium]
MATATATSLGKLQSILGNDAASLLQHECKTIPKSQLHLPGPDFITRIFATSD